MLFPTISIFIKISLPLPIKLAPLTGSCITPFLTIYPSETAKLNSPVTGLTDPPPIFLAYNPSLIDLIISSGLSSPLAI